MHLNMSYNDIRQLPIMYRRWFIKRLTKHFQMKKDSYDKVDRGSNGRNDTQDNNIDMSKVKKFFDSKNKK